MQLPRFTSGEVGRLTFAHLNDLFARLEALEAAARNPLGVAGTRGRVVTARVTQQSSPGVYRWVEVERNGNAWTDKPDGLSSKDGATPPNEDAFPIIGAILEPAPIPIVISPQYKQDGSLFYSPTAPGAEGFAFYKVTNFANLELGKRWTYTLKKQKIGLVNNVATWQNDDSAANVVGLNGAENRTDPPYMTATNDLYGVGWARPQGGYVQSRNPIQIGIVVAAQPIPGSSYYGFSMGNGYSTVCI
jgi:hypothetical protein